MPSFRNPSFSSTPLLPTSHQMAPSIHQDDIGRHEEQNKEDHSFVLKDRAHVLVCYPKEPDDKRYQVRALSEVDEFLIHNQIEYNGAIASIANIPEDKMAPEDHLEKIRQRKGGGDKSAQLARFRRGLQGAYCSPCYYGKGNRRVWVMNWKDGGEFCQLRCTWSDQVKISRELGIKSFYDLAGPREESYSSISNSGSSSAPFQNASTVTNAPETHENRPVTMTSAYPSVEVPLATSTPALNQSWANSTARPTPPPAQQPNFSGQVRPHGMYDDHRPASRLYPVLDVAGAGPGPATGPRYSTPESIQPSIEMRDVSTNGYALHTNAVQQPMPTSETKGEIRVAGAVTVHATHANFAGASPDLPNPKTQCLVHVRAQNAWTTQRWGELEALHESKQIFLHPGNMGNGFNPDVDRALWLELGKKLRRNEFKVVGLAIRDSLRNKEWFHITVLVELTDDKLKDYQRRYRQSKSYSHDGPIRVTRTDFFKVGSVEDLEEEARRTPVGRNWLASIEAKSIEACEPPRGRTTTPEAEQVRTWLAEKNDAMELEKSRLVAENQTLTAEVHRLMAEVQRLTLGA